MPFCLYPMPVKRPPQPSQSLNLEPPNSGGSSPGSTHFPRATSPSGLSLLTKPSKWFRSASAKNIPASTEPRSSISSVTRKPKISRPTDPRPILNSLSSDTYAGSGAGSRYVYFLFMTLPGHTALLSPLHSVWIREKRICTDVTSSRDVHGSHALSSCSTSQVDANQEIGLFSTCLPWVAQVQPSIDCLLYHPPPPPLRGP